MRHFMNFMIIIFALGFIMAIFSCTTNKNQVSNAEISLIAETVPEGILLTFCNIPLETTRLTITIKDLNDEYYPEFNRINYSAIAEITGYKLEQIKQFGNVIFPFTQMGHKYEIFAIFHYYYENDAGVLVNLDIRPCYVKIDYIANVGNFCKIGIKLEMNDCLKSVNLIYDSNILSGLYFDQPKFNFVINILRSNSENNSHIITIGDRNNANGLYWEFNNEVVNIMKDEYYLWYYREIMEYQNYVIAYWHDDPLTEEIIEWFNGFGVHLAYVSAFCNIIYNEITWKIKIAKSPIFIYSL